MWRDGPSFMKLHQLLPSHLRLKQRVPFSTVKIEPGGELTQLIRVLDRYPPASHLVPTLLSGDRLNSWQSLTLRSTDSLSPRTDLPYPSHVINY